MSAVPQAVVQQVRSMITSATFRADVQVPWRPGWIGCGRIADGLEVRPIGLMDTWVVLPGPSDDRPAMVRCTCCERLMLGCHEAMAIADNAYPPLVP